MPARLMLAPAGARLPPGVHAVAAVLSIRDTTRPAAGGPASAGGRASRGGGLVVAAAAGSEAEGAGNDVGSARAKVLLYVRSRPSRFGDGWFDSTLL